MTQLRCSPGSRRSHLLADLLRTQMKSLVFALLVSIAHALPSTSRAETGPLAQVTNGTYEASTYLDSIKTRSLVFHTLSHLQETFAIILLTSLERLGRVFALHKHSQMPVPNFHCRMASRSKVW
jgi:hypothetical protein